MLAVGLPEDIPNDDEVQLQREPSLEKTKTSARDAVRIPTIATSGFGSAKLSSEMAESATDVTGDCYTELGRDLRSGERIFAVCLVHVGIQIPVPSPVDGKREIEGLGEREKREGYF
ncbi:hypothetical protein TIFTF001_016914 [Ficus carica]|uniref:Uncharacterized protein n=1 Tax=Ficus carica TaxID=3494 RepID=A0AA88A8L4_FICCA|nr:hypothetical protein TIFTF001_016914 [Ficus carica]